MESEVIRKAIQVSRINMHLFAQIILDIAFTMENPKFGVFAQDIVISVISAMPHTETTCVIW